MSLVMVIAATPYPKPKPQTAEEQACLELRATIVGTASIEIYVNLGSNLELLGGQNWMTWEDVSSYLLKWGNEPFGNANPNLEKNHRRRRQIIVNYRKEVATIGLKSNSSETRPLV